MTMIFGLTLPGFGMLMTDRRVHVQASDGDSAYHDGASKLRRTRDGWAAAGGLLEVGQRALQNAHEVIGAAPALAGELIGHHVSFCAAHPRLGDDLGRALHSSFAIIYASDGEPELLTVDCAAGTSSRKASGCYAAMPSDLAPERKAELLANLQRGTAEAPSGAALVRLAGAAFAQAEALSPCVSASVDVGLIVPGADGPRCVRMSGSASDFARMTDAELIARLRPRDAIAYADATAGCTWEIARLEDGQAAGSVVGPVPVSTTFLDDEIDDEADPSGLRLDVSYQVFLYDENAALVDVRYTNVLVQRRTACP